MKSSCWLLMLGNLLSLFMVWKVLESRVLLLATGVFLPFLCYQYLYISDLAPSKGDSRDGML